MDTIYTYIKFKKGKTDDELSHNSTCLGKGRGEQEADFW